MTDLEAVEWSNFVNFANHVPSDDPRKELQKHRETRGKCYAKPVTLWQKVANAAAIEPRYQPPAERVRAAKEAFALAGLAAKPPKTVSLTLVLYDSFSQPALAGIRSGATRVRHMLYRAEPYQIDLQIEVQPEGRRIVVSGQLLDLSHPEMVGSDVQVTLSNRRENTVNVMTNQFGEFRADVENSGDLELSFLGSSAKPIVILLRGALDPLSPAQD
jgi:hypothetical protein